MIKKPRGWDCLKWWDSGERQAIEERLEERVAKGYSINPTLDKVYRALDLVSFEDCKVAVIGQDPYPEPRYASGVAFSIPTGARGIPPTLGNVFTEYSADLHLDAPNQGNLERWCRQGVLLWNAVPTCEAGRRLDHRDYGEWKVLTSEVVESLADKGIVFAFLGNTARRFAKTIRDTTVSTEVLKRDTKGYVSKGIIIIDKERSLDNTIIELSHPSPRGNGKNPFLGSRVFTSINASLVSKGYQPIDWRLS